MTIARSLVCVFAAAGLLAACSKSATTASGSNQAAAGAAPAASGPDVTITENDLPRPKAGEWVTTVTGPGGTPMTLRHCETGAPVQVRTADFMKHCSQFSIKRTFLGHIVVDATCGTGPVAMTMHTDVHGDFTGGYISDSTGSVTMQGQPARTMTTHSEAHYEGPCTGNSDG